MDRQINKTNYQENNNYFEIFVVEKSHEIYHKGREVAQSMYHQVWRTENLEDSNDYGTVVFWQGKVVANINIQLKQEYKDIQSEYFFAKEHWKNYLKFNFFEAKLAEISGLAISKEIPNSLSRPVLMMLILGLRIMQYPLNIRHYTTVQHDFLIRILKQSLNLPFQVNELIKQPSKQIPNDDYWQLEKPPRIYYLDGYSQKAVQACDSYFYYLNSRGFKMSFYSLIFKSKINFSLFWKLWTSDQSLSLKSINKV